MSLMSPILLVTLTVMFRHRVKTKVVIIYASTLMAIYIILLFADKEYTMPWMRFIVT